MNTLRASWFPTLLLLLLCVALPAGATDEVRLSSGESVYVPVYANVFSAPKALPFPLATILSVRNTDPTRSIVLTAADYYDTKGKFLHAYVTKERPLAPLESTFVYLPAEGPGGGVGANFIVRWKAAQEVNAPIIECVMLGTKSGQGISFVSPGQVIREESR